jgi:tetratricopeptide (TPR) repeat protein
MFGNEQLNKYLEGALLNTDDKPLVEFARESVREERIIISELINLKENVLSLIEEPLPNEDIVRKLNDYDEGSRWMMQGQLETWYPTGIYGSSIAQRRALLYTPDNEDVRHNLNFSEQTEEKVLEALEKNPNHPMALYDLGRIAMEKGDFETAEKYLLQSLTVRNNLPQAALQLGLLRLFQKRYEESAGILQQILTSTAQKSPVVNFAYLESLIKLGIDVDDAIKGKESIARQVPEISEYLEMMEKTVLMMRERFILQSNVD